MPIIKLYLKLLLKKIRKNNNIKYLLNCTYNWRIIIDTTNKNKYTSLFLSLLNYIMLCIKLPVYLLFKNK